VSDLTLVLRRANGSRKGAHWQDDDDDVFDSEHDVGRVYLVNSNASTETWFWGVSFLLTNRNSYGHAPTLDAAKSAFKAEFERWRQEAGKATFPRRGDAYARNHRIERDPLDRELETRGGRFLISPDQHRQRAAQPGQARRPRGPRARAAARHARAPRKPIRGHVRAVGNRSMISKALAETQELFQR
jgi:hypothetical protein